MYIPYTQLGLSNTLEMYKIEDKETIFLDVFEFVNMISMQC